MALIHPQTPATPGSNAVQPATNREAIVSAK